MLVSLDLGTVGQVRLASVAGKQRRSKPPFFSKGWKLDRVEREQSVLVLALSPPIETQAPLEASCTDIEVEGLR